jgi:hypothetical protein
MLIASSADIRKQMPNWYWTEDLKPMPEIDMPDVPDVYMVISCIAVHNAMLSIAVARGVGG